jgi:predicted MFS family arabinose efflux permease
VGAVTGAAVREPLWRSPALRALVGATALGFASYCLTLASLPAYAVAGGADPTAAGAVTTVFLLVTIAVQMAVPALTVRFGLGRVLAAGLLALGGPAPLYALSDSLTLLLPVSAVRGVGFAVLTVLGSTLAALVAPPERRGESFGLYGLAIAVPNLVAVPAGVALVLSGHTGWLAWLAATPVLALPLVPRLTRAVPARGGPAAADRADRRRAVAAALLPSAVLFVVTLAGGAVVTFLPIERPDGALATVALLLLGVTAAGSRWRAGVLADRMGLRLLLPLTVLVSAAGLGLLAGGLRGPAVVVGAGAALFGLGYGAAQNLTLLATFRRVGDVGATTASAFWNAGFDAGTGVGALLPGLLAAAAGLPWTYAVLTACLLAVVPLARAATRGTALS